VDYQNKEDEIVEFVKNNFNEFTEKPINHFLNEYLDLDQYKYDSSLWFSFDDYNYQELTNQSRLETCNLRVFVVVRNDKENELHTKLRGYASSFYNMFENSVYNFGGVVDMGLITGVNFYDAVEGDKSKKLAELTMTLVRETI
jgi:hypothetical protein